MKSYEPTVPPGLVENLYLRCKHSAEEWKAISAAHDIVSAASIYALCTLHIDTKFTVIVYFHCSRL